MRKDVAAGGRFDVSLGSGRRYNLFFKETIELYQVRELYIIKYYA